MKIYGDILYVEKRYCYFNRIQNYLNPLVDQINCVYTRGIYFIKWVTIKLKLENRRLHHNSVNGK